MTTPSQSSSKTQYVRDALNELGLDANFAETAKWVKNKHGVEIPDPIFYTTRKEMRRLAQTDAASSATGAEADSTAAAAEPKPAAAKASKSARSAQKKKTARIAKKPAPVAAAPKSSENVADLVYKAQALVQHLGKDEAKKLIDVL